MAKRPFKKPNYKQYTGERGSEEAWKKAAEKLLMGKLSSNEHLKVLGLTVMPTLDELKKAYRKMMLKVHPDRGGSAEEATAVTNAYEALLKEVSP